jgi:hypothetical protein
MRLWVAVVLIAPHGDERVGAELLPQERDQRRDRERVPIDEDDDLVRIGRVGHEVAEERQFALVLLQGNVGRVEELRSMLHQSLVQPRIYAVGLLDVALEVAELDVDPAVVRPVHGRDVDHKTEQVRGCLRTPACAAGERWGRTARTQPRGVAAALRERARMASG